VREIALHLLDILQNCIEAGATCVDLSIDEDIERNLIVIRVADDGRGMDKATVARVLDPFYTSRRTRHVGLGLPLLAAAAERADGRLRVTSEQGKGTTVEVEFRLDHPDRQPLGELTSTVMAFLLSEHAPVLRYAHRVRRPDRPPAEFSFDTGEMASLLGNVPLGAPVVREWLQGYIAEGEADVASVTP
jgi:hypothetical protein